MRGLLGKQTAGGARRQALTFGMPPRASALATWKAPQAPMDLPPGEGRNTMKVGSTTRAFYLVTALAVVAPLPVVAQSPETCIAYMEADAIYNEAKHQHDEACRAEAAKHESNKLRVAAVWLCMADGPRDGKSMHKIEEARRRAYRAAYSGPTSDIESVMTKLVRIDRIRCRKRFETVR